MQKSIGLPDGHPFFLGDDLGFDKALNGFCRVLVRPRRASPHTWRSYAYAGAEYLDFCDARNVDWMTANEEHLTDFYNIKTEGTETLAGVNGKSWNLTSVVLSHLYKYAQQTKLRDDIPITYRPSRSSYQHGKGETSELNVPTTAKPLNYIVLDQYKGHWRPYLLTKEHSQRNISLIELLICSGFRIAEALGLTIYNIPDPDSSAYSGRAAVPIVVIGKGRKKRTVPVPKRIIRAIHFYIDEDRKAAAAKYKSRNCGKEATHLFLAETGEPLSKRMVEEVFQQTSESTGLKLIPHGCRHTYATIMLDALIKVVGLKNEIADGTVADKYESMIGDPLLILQKLLGHASIETVFTYLELTPEAQLVIEDALADWTATLA
ncbi:TPA: tyrosine-type recombinase/integrase [Burkholderia vietnamiensis]|nr:tyrosine-type recombinase/integrase [Burkholderia vietnamiensis]